MQVFMTRRVPEVYCEAFEIEFSSYSPSTFIPESGHVCANGSRWSKYVLRKARNSFLQSHEDLDSTYRVIYSKIKTFSVSYIIRHCVALTMQYGMIVVHPKASQTTRSKSPLRTQ